MSSENDDHIKVFVIGFAATEHRLLDATVRLSQRRKPPIALIGRESVDEADVVIIDVRDADAMNWAAGRKSWLMEKPVIWVDGDRAPAGHTLVRRPVQWPILPMLLARALDNSGATRTMSAVHAPAPSPSAAQHAPAASRPGAAPAANKRVLVVDDSLAVRLHLRSLLEPQAITVVEADSGEAAIAAFQSSSFACILMDVLMPGIDGYEACRTIKSKSRGGQASAVVMLTSRTSPFDRIRGKMAGCDAYLTKPVDPKQLHETLLHYLERS